MKKEGAESELNSLRKVLREKDSPISQLNETVREKNIRISQLEETINLIKDTLGWRALEKFRRLRKTLPYDNFFFDVFDTAIIRFAEIIF